GSREQVVDDILMAALMQLAVPQQQSLPRDEQAFTSLVTEIEPKLIAYSQDIANLVQASLVQLVEVRKQLKQHKNNLALAYCIADINDQLKGLFYEGLIYATPAKWLAQYPKYLKAIILRLEKALLNPQKDRLAIAQVATFSARLTEVLEKEGDYRITQLPDLMDYRWGIEEFRISLFAQTLKTSIPISDKRLEKQWESVKAAF